ncbi:CDP-diacylglycerol--glycerol-3-phosphate 3-phosphatidyltransferase [Rickettsiales bacterium]|nr:CDP-diacylglycerol--glycerol-3-phosphate 3-phosphatidyltransferase [Rickettsiales bacterium]
MNKNLFSNLPNYLTIFRVISIPIIIICILPQSFFYNWIAVIIYALACVSDFFDGYIARKLRVETKFGKFFDPIADKVLIISIIFILVAIDKIEGLFIYPALIIIIREVLVSGLREFLSNEKNNLNVTMLSKWKTLLQMISLGFIIIGNDFTYFKNTLLVGEIGLTIASIITIYTGYKYFKNNFKSL